MTLNEIFSRPDIALVVGVALIVGVYVGNALAWMQMAKRLRAPLKDWRLSEANGSVVGIDQHRRPRRAWLRRMQPSWLRRREPLSREVLGKIGAPGLQRGRQS